MDKIREVTCKKCSVTEMTKCCHFGFYVHSLSLSVLMAIFPGKPGLAGRIGANDDGSGGNNWSYISRAELQSNCHH